MGEVFCSRGSRLEMGKHSPEDPRTINFPRLELMDATGGILDGGEHLDGCLELEELALGSF